MNGADALISTLAANNVTACFGNPGTSEMQFVAALDRYPAMRPVLCLFEGVATGAADGYGRIADRPACTLLHLGPGYANGAANLHNARRAFTPIVNVIGDHATYHRQYDAPLNSDIATLVEPNSIWIKSAEAPGEVSALAAQAVAAAAGPPAGPVSLILPADTAWLPADQEIVQARTIAIPAPAAEAVDAVAKAMKAAKKPVLLLGGKAARQEAMIHAGRLKAAGVEVYVDTFVARRPAGSGGFRPKVLPYFGEMALNELAGADLMVLVGTTTPVAFFAYPDRPSVLAPEGCEQVTLAARWEDAVAGLSALADALGAPKEGPTQPFQIPDTAPTGKLSAHAAGLSIARHMPEGTVICDDAVTSSLGVAIATFTARPHELLQLTGGAIGAGLPLAIGAAVAAPDRQVLSLNGDGSAMYTLQALWTIAREELNVITVVFANQSYRILTIEMIRTGAGEIGPAAKSLLDLGRPTLDFVALAEGMGVPALRCETAEDFEKAIAAAMGRPGPFLIEAVID